MYFRALNEFWADCQSRGSPELAAFRLRSWGRTAVVRARVGVGAGRSEMTGRKTA